jgi:hypothetical protein
MFFTALLPSNGNLEIGEEIRKLILFCNDIHLLTIKENIISGLKIKLDKNSLESQLTPITDEGLYFLPDVDSGGRYMTGVVAKNHESAKTFQFSGPVCCSSKHGLNIVDPVSIIGKPLTSNDPRLFIHYKYINLSLVSWNPHSYICEDSILIADKIEDLMRSENEQKTNQLMEILFLPATWSLTNGQVEVTTKKFKMFASSSYSPNFLKWNFNADNSL